ncbi:MAG: glycosyltransferase [Pseudoxanthomonas sp.]
MLNIIHFVENLERGGLERTVIDLIGAQREAGHQCRVICLFRRGALASELIAEGVMVDECDKKNGFDISAVRRARRLLSRSPGAILHTHNATAHYHAMLASLRLPLSCIVNTRHGMGDGNQKSRREWLYRASVRYTDYVVTVCEAAREHFFRDGVCPRMGLHSIPNGIRVERFATSNAQARSDLVAKLGLSIDSRIIGTVGRLQPVKDHNNLLEAFARTRKAIPSAALAIIGDGPLRDLLERRAADLGISDSVRFLGDRSDVHDLLAGLDIFALSSVSEGYSVALLEACAAGLPIVATEVGGNNEIVRDGVNGCLVRSRDPEALSVALTGLLRAPERSAAMASAGRQWALAEASFRTMAARYLALYCGRYRVGAVSGDGMPAQVSMTDGIALPACGETVASARPVPSKAEQ